MAIWKKIIVSGSTGQLANLEVDSLSSGVVTGNAGNLTTTPIAGIGNIVATHGATGNFSGSFSGSFIGDGSGLTGLASNLTVGADTGTDTTVNLLNDTLEFTGGKNISATVGTDSITYNLGNGILSASAITAPATQGQVQLSTNGTAQSAININSLGTGDTPTFGGLNVTNDVNVDGSLTVNGTLSYLNTTNTEIKDKFILLNSGSSNPDDAGIVVDEGSGQGAALVYDGGKARWGFVETLSAATGSVETQAYSAAVLDQNDSDHNVAAAYFQKRGNIKVDSSDNIWIYV